MKILISNACVITCDSCNVIPNGFVVINDGRIEQLGKMPVPRTTGGDKKIRVIDACGRIVMPGFINPHMHLYSQFARGIAVPKMRSFVEILDSLWWRLDKVLTLEDVYYSSLLGLIEAIRSGVTTVVDHHASYGCIKGSLGKVIKGFRETGVRGAVCYEVSDRAGEKDCDLAIEENLSSISAPLVGNMFGLHASFTLSGATLKKVRKANEKSKLPYHIHVAEGPEDLADAKSRYGKSVVTRLYDEGILMPNTIAAHCIHINDNDMTLLKKSGAFVIHNPLSNMNNAVGTAPYLKMCANGIPVGIGTDGMSAGIMDDVRTASVLHKAEASDPQAGWKEVETSTLTTNALVVSNLLGLSLGSIKPGAPADVIMIDCKPFTEVNSGNFWGHILFGVANSSVHTTICDGQVLMEGHKIVIDETGIVSEASKLSKKMWKRFS